MFRTATILLTVLTISAPLALAANYVGPAGVMADGTRTPAVILCDAGAGYGVGGYCELPCDETCTVTTVDSAGAPITVMVCDWDGSADVNCDIGGSVIAHTSETGVIDIYVFNGVAGTISVE